MLYFLYSVDFNGRNAQDGQTAPQCPILSKPVNWQPLYGGFSSFQNGGRRRLGF